MNRCVIITAFQSAPLLHSFDFHQSDFIICADGGYMHAAQVGLRPHVLIGDFDSLGKEALELQKDFEGSGGRIIRLPAEKDDTDTLYCLKYG
ncbi:MAG: thiamine diphosphokinase, partial [Bacillota bacterium]|nr:thiamine diphosphokinase [Bacillota bacterium]